MDSPEFLLVHASCTRFISWSLNLLLNLQFDGVAASGSKFASSIVARSLSFLALELCLAGGADLETFNTLDKEYIQMAILSIFGSFRNCIMRSNEEGHKIAPKSIICSRLIKITPFLILPVKSHNLIVLSPIPNTQSITPTDLLDLDDRGRNGCNSSHITLSGGSTSCLHSSNNLHCFSTVSVRTTK